MEDRTYHSKTGQALVISLCQTPHQQVCGTSASDPPVGSASARLATAGGQRCQSRKSGDG